MKPTILTVGLNHTTAEIQIRERIATLHCEQETSVNHLSERLQKDLFPESLVLSTCNRTEVYVLTENPEQARMRLHRLFGESDALSKDLKHYLYTYTDKEAVQHLFSVAAGLDSLILGESEILGQVRNAYLYASERQLVGPVFHRLFKDAIHTGKRAHSETSIGSGAASAATAAIKLAREILGSLAKKTVFVLGAGEMAQRLALNLGADHACAVIVANRTFERAAEIARRVMGQAIRYEELLPALESADLVITATGAPHILLEAGAIAQVMLKRPDRPLCIMDVALPRNVDPAAADIPNVRLLNIDDLKNLIDEHRAVRERAALQAKYIVAEETDAFLKWYEERLAAPILAGLHRRAEAIRTAEFERAMRRLKHLDLSDRDRNIIAALSAGIVNKLLAAPTVHLKERTQRGDGQLYYDALRELFELETDGHQDLSSAV